MHSNFPIHAVFLASCCSYLKSLFKTYNRLSGPSADGKRIVSLFFSIQNTILKTILGTVDRAWWLGSALGK